MREVSDTFLLNLAVVSSTLVGFFLIGVFYYIETGFRRTVYGREVVGQYFYSGTRIVLVLFAFPIGLSLTLVALEPFWNHVFFAILSLLLIAANLDSALRMWAVERVTHSAVLLANEVLSTLVVLVLVPLPWVLGGFAPTREDLTWAILLAFAMGYLSIGATVLSAFNLSRIEDSD